MSSLIMQYFLNDRLEPAVLRRQIAQMAAAGLHGVYAHARTGLLTPYFSQAWWDALDVIRDACRQHGLEMWIWDEDYWPSGLAAGRLVWEDPGLAARLLEFDVVRVSGGHLEVDFAPGLLLRAVAVSAGGEVVDVTAHCGTRRQQWGPRQILHRAYSPLISDIGHPHWRTWMSDNRFALSWDAPADGEWLVVATRVVTAPGVACDFLRRDAMRRFLEFTHQTYHDHYGADFGGLIPGVFTDEPNPAGLFPWTRDFPAEFGADHGYELLDQLHHLAADIDARTPSVRHHYRETVGRLIRTHYVQQMADWCEAHRIKLAGHLTRTEWLSLDAGWWPNELRCYQPMHIPSCDPLGGSVGMADAAAYHTGVKGASSAAHLFGREQAGADVLAVIGDECGLRELKYLLDYHLVLGLNHFTLHGASYSFTGARKDEVPPPLFMQHTQWPFMRRLWAETARLAEALTGGEHVCEVAVLYPSTSLGCDIDAGCGGYPDLPGERPIHELSEALLSHQIDFDFIDEITLAEQVDDAGELHTPEQYRVIVLPHLRFVGRPAAEALTRFAAAGGRVVAVGSLPAALPTCLAEPDTSWAGGLELWAEADDGRLAALPRLDLEGDGARDVFVLRRQRDGCERTFVFNRGEGVFSGTLDGLALQLPAHGSRLLPDDEPVALGGAAVAELAGGWEVAFEPNQVPLSFWHVESPLGSEPGYGGKFALPTMDLLRREPDPAGKGDGPARCWLRFMLTGDVPDARLVAEPEGFGGEWELAVNGQLVTGWEATDCFGDFDLDAPVGHLLRGGSTPALNVLCLTASGPGRGVREIPYLCGSFTAEYRHGHPSFPSLHQAPSTRHLPSLLPWDALGYPTFSGAATYARTVDLPAGDYVLDLGRVEDACAVRWDGVEIAVLGWPPYVCRLDGVTKGQHRLEIEVRNPPANRVRMSGKVAGLLGPVVVRQG
ncbi:MAG: hypothetical protein HYU66_21240 [Armatimonadetes bacterium]|nr:hypothetical protein [Armatimonadota bacterium]